MLELKLFRTHMTMERIFVGMIGIRIRKMREGIWVPIMMGTIPMGETSRDAMNAPTPLAMLQTIMIIPMCSLEICHCLSYQREQKLLGVKYPANESMTMKTPMMEMSFRVRAESNPRTEGIIERVQLNFYCGGASYFCVGGIASTSSFKKRYSTTRTNPQRAYPNITNWCAANSDNPFLFKTLIKYPTNPHPSANPVNPKKLYHPIILDISESILSIYPFSLHLTSAISLKTACYIGKKGPVSPPVTEMTPIIPTTHRMQQFLIMEKMIPVINFKNPERIRVFFLPILSALEVNIQFTMKFPIRIMVISIPI